MLSFSPNHFGIGQDFKLSNAFIGLLLVSLLLVLSRVVYRIWFHPLSKYPGPKLYHSTNLVRVYYVLRGEWVHKVTAQHVKYGPVVRVGPNELSYVSEQAWTDIYKARKGEEQLKKFLPESPGFQHGLMDNPFDDEQQICKKALSSGINDKSIRQKEFILQNNITKLVTELKKRVTTPDSAEALDLAKCLECAAFDIIGDFVSGENFGCLDKLELNPLYWELTTMLKQLAIGCGFATSRLTRPLLFKPPPDLTPIEIRKRRERRAALETKPVDDILYHAFKGVDTPHGMYTKLAERVAGDAIMGGFDTIAIAMVGAMYFLVKNPTKMAKLQDEIRSAFKNAEEITLAKAMSLEYLTAVFSETLRLWPPGPETLRRVTNAKGNIIHGEWVPPNTLVGVYHWTAGRYPDAWVDVNEFVPERWLPEGRRGRYKDDNHGVINPFQLGPRNCPGQSLANAEFRLVIAHLIWNFDIVAAETPVPDWSKTKIFGLIAEKQALMVELRTRT